jgi:hypothetical protein
MMRSAKIIEWVLRIGVFGTFVGHGCYAIGGKPQWIPLLTAFGFSEQIAVFLLPVIGWLDLVIALIVLLRPFKPVLYWAVCWTFLTALSRIVSGESVFEFFERFSNIACPLALLLYYGLVPVENRLQETERVYFSDLEEK